MLAPSPSPWVPPAGEREMGLETYATSRPGTGGRWKISPEDFEVDEISRYPLPDPQGRFTIVRAEAHDVEQNALVQRIQRALGLPPGAVGFAGTKDRRAVTRQLLSIPVRPERLGELRLSGVRLEGAYCAAEGLALGHLYGNRFRLRVGGIEGPPEEIAAKAQGILEELRALGGFANFFGPQRFGEVRPVTHVVGRALVKGSAKEAVDAYLIAGVGEKVPEGHEARAAYADHRDASRALREFPVTFSFERTLLRKLAEGKSGEQALRALPRSLRQLFVHAYQSFLFNRLLSRRLKEGLPLGGPIPGDRVIRLAPDGLDRGSLPVPVSEDNLPEASAWVRSGRARVAGALVGTETSLQEGVPGRLLREVLDEEEVQPRAFHLPEAPELSSRGTYRAFLAPLPLRLFPEGTPRAEQEHEGAHPSSQGGSLRFDLVLEKGQYATVLLREFLKVGAAPVGTAGALASAPSSS
ncbi:MAG: tRNA pseudouridine(13) synthase TruD [Euryarchaeota archaeon]|nr:tRNA pseudouridine(13) synthase TruD [Euryarchaeota archaeon]MDE1835421.1 tRNA pseudouridine(13) synthase TruD [Euryarchaeota archaeon]MDE2046072.1 tRNA pseudouridine(13) synthase TruD [Thermoplasmata archaeon]